MAMIKFSDEAAGRGEERAMSPPAGRKRRRTGWRSNQWGACCYSQSINPLERRLSMKEHMHTQSEGERTAPVGVSHS